MRSRSRVQGRGGTIPLSIIKLRNEAALRKLGWHVITSWECTLHKNPITRGWRNACRACFANSDRRLA